MNLNQRQNEEVEMAPGQVSQHAGEMKFESAEEMLRHDAASMEVPAGIADRLAESAHSGRSASWWRRWFG
jgi:hypothetical protein